ncbi:MAG: tRNA (adenosine(37)-N6)-threonylcarbamoyltransferase complex dimerization subunit type 1 TsaB [Rhodospirillaceae bacterium]|jgi:tRNA threonylcarbamoyladenosine biosynthesis protein TsaB|nr:tRNA (adenosine(37)-N6)-threonylcarbamoyltransferase complex dimerization subunit type 1 TsaB [Rhodospirillaceae bacterium]MBT5667723.1 tRNA (adenosine(37)-N6)-threonylcarbamoyltransferase complex dimerization subunit type 1 TsaB [Rhodospirillaceae bacterium]MBT5811438.1 tRNA (adenosine(37)-N6)-threonylcarbamoyltransferase complex dimerization subunit type 1 TsaB [Rhodospirillaceae bacterium]
MKILALDSATAACSTAVWIDEAVTARRYESMSRGHAARLMPMVRDVMAESGLAFGEIDYIATTTGPGGFTGLRIGLAAARAIALAAKIPIVGYTTFEVVARSPRSWPAPRPLLVVMDAKRADFYFQLFRSDGAALTAPATAPPAGIAAALRLAMVSGDPVAICGDGADAVIEELDAYEMPLRRIDGPDAPDAAVLARIAQADIGVDEAMFDTEMRPPEPLYLRPPDAALPR